MSAKDLFKDKKSKKVMPISSTEEMGRSAESKRYIEEYSKKRDRFFPRVDFSTASNFARFGSAEEYYVQTIKRIYNTYPYDGSLYEKIAWENSSSYLDLDFFNNKYPRTNGYAIISPGSDWGTQAAAVNGIGIPTATSDIQYITFQGGPNQDPDNSDKKKIFPDLKHRVSGAKGANIYDADKRRQNNLKYDASEGVTIEFWLRKEGLVASAKTTEECVFDLWNGSNMATEEYGRLSVRVMTSNTATSATPLELSFQSGSVTGSFTFTSLAKSEMVDNKWHHYALTLKNNGTAMESELYFDGAFRELKSGASKAINEILPAQNSDSGSMTANLGAYRTVSGSQGAGYGKLSGSIDDFRYWKTKRDAEQIGRFYRDQVGGGTNVDDANLDLGVYFKFNEGITQTSSVDARVLDYSGRLSNGYWTGYGSTSRNTGSAIVSSNAATHEFKDPIIYSFHPTVKSLEDEYKKIGQEHDHTNNGSLYRSLPEWIISEDGSTEQHLLKLTQIMASYFDTLALQIKSLPTIKSAEYVSSSYEPSFFTHKLIENHGLAAPEIFVNADVLEQFLERDEKNLFKNSLHKTKNLIYQNIYNNLTYIAKTKGTEKSFRNLIRCFGIDDELININLYGNNSTFRFDDDQLRYTSTKKKYIDFNSATRNSAVVFQQTGSSGTTNTLGYISGSAGSIDDQGAENSPFIEKGGSITFECDTIFPKKMPPHATGYYEFTDLSSSVYGVHTAKKPATAIDTGWSIVDDSANFQVFATRDKSTSPNVKFVLTGTAGGRIPELSSSLFYDVYDNERWNFAVRLVPSRFPWASGISGSYQDDEASPKYSVEFYGVNMAGNVKQNSFYLTGTIDRAYGDAFLKKPKRMYVGAHRTGFTGSVLQKSDIKVGSARVWMDRIKNEVIDAHARDILNFGTANPYESAYLFESANAGGDGAPGDFAMTSSFGFVPQMATLALNWDFEQVTGSDNSGEFVVADTTSGSVHFTNYAGNTVKQSSDFGPMGQIAGYHHPGSGYGFPVSSSKVLDVEYVSTARQLPPEMLNNSDMVKVLTHDDEVFERDTRPESLFIAVEKSMYRVISEEILRYFATIKDFNNLIGEPVNRYRHSYKKMEKIRSLIFKNFKNTPDLDKYIDYYRWVDESINDVIEQLFPASAAFSENIRTVVESHVLERNKYVNKFPTTEERLGTVEEGEPMARIVPARPRIKNVDFMDFKMAPPTLGYSLDQSKHTHWWANLNEDSIHLTTSGKADVDAARQKIMKAVNSALGDNAARRHGQSKVGSGDDFSVRFTRTIGTGHNVPGADRGVMDPALKPMGDANRKLTIKAESSTLRTVDRPEVGKKPWLDTAYNAERASYKARVHAEINSEGDASSGYSNAKQFFSNIASIYEYDDGTAEFTNIHNDGAYNSPMQSPFTQKNVGGFGHRRVDLNLPLTIGGAFTADNLQTRPEKFRIKNAASNILTGSSPQTAATATITVIDSSSPPGVPYIGEGDTIQLISSDETTVTLTLQGTGGSTTSATTSGTTLTAKTLSAGSYANTTLHATAQAVEIRTAINHHKRFSATNSANVITVTQTKAGSAGNTAITITELGAAGMSKTDFTGGDDAHVVVYAPDLDHRNGNVEYAFPRATWNQGPKRPVNIENIKISTGSLAALGNYQNNYEVINISGRTANNKWLKENRDTAQTSSETPWITLPSASDAGRILGDIAAGDPRIGSARSADYLLPTRPRHESVIVERFSSPGDFLTMTRGFLDPMAEEYSVYNALPWRYHYQLNSSGSVTDQGQTGSVALGTKGALGILGEDYTTRAGVHMAQHITSSVHVNEEFSGLNVLLSRHQGQFGIDNPIGSVRENDYNSKAHYHKIHRNRLKRLEYTSTDSGRQYTVATGSTYDNWYVQHAIPRNDLQYAWITASAFLRKDPFGHTSTRPGYDGLTTASLNLGSLTYPHVEALTFISRSEICSYVSNEASTGYRRWWSQPWYQTGEREGTIGQSTYTDRVPVDFVGMNINIYEPITASTNILGYPTMETTPFGTDHYRNNLFNLGFLGKKAEGYTLANGPGSDGTHATWRNSSGDGTVLNALLLHRNGPYGYPTWKQIRAGEHPVARHHKKNNTIQYIEIEQTSSQTKKQTGGSYYVNQFHSEKEKAALEPGPRFAKTIKSFTTSPITNKYAPIVHDVVDRKGNNIVLRHAYGNNLNYMPQEKLNANMPTVHPSKEEQVYDRLTEDIRDNETLGLNRLIYSEKIFPKDEYTYLDVARSRTDYDQTKAQFSTGTLGTQRTFWQSTGSARLRQAMARNSMDYPYDINAGSSSYELFSTLTRGPHKYNPPALSIWPLENATSIPGWHEQTPPYMAGELIVPSAISMYSSMIDGYFAASSTTIYGFPTASQQYAFANAFIATYNAFNGTMLYDRGWMLGSYKMFRTPEISGKQPWYNSYEEYASNMRPLSQDYTILPEFRISEHMDHYIDNGFSFQNNRFLTLDGAQTGVSASAPSTSGSYNSDFFKTYSHSDFMKYFGKISEDHEGLADPTKISLKCSGVKKLLPYNGFYPMLRCLQLGSEFSSSYAPHISGSTLAVRGHNRSHWLQSLLQPFYAPGIMYNTIKSGIAVDWPCFTGSIPAGVGYGRMGFVDSDIAKFDFRMPFEAIIEPHSYLPLSSSDGKSGLRFVYPHTASDDSVITIPEMFCDWRGDYDTKYSLAANNFFGEVPRFFLKDGNLNTYVSKPESQFKPMRSGSTYFMDIEMYSSEEFAMSVGYDRIMAQGANPGSGFDGALLGLRGGPYGYPCRLYGSAARPFKQRGATDPTDFGKACQGLPGYKAAGSVSSTWGVQGNMFDPAYAPFTPPYFYGKSTARITFSPHQHITMLEGEKRQFTLDEILAGARIETTNTSSNSLLVFSKEVNPHLAGREAMVLSASMNLFGKSRLKAVEYDATGKAGSFQATTARDSGDSAFDVWTISTKFESPIMNFSGSETENIVEMATKTGWSAMNAAHTFGLSSSIGQRMMWQGYGALPSGSDGIFIDMKESFPIQILGQSLLTGSLIDVCGFSPEQKRLGELADEKLISEAVLAIPFVESDGKRKFFNIDRELYDFAAGRLSEPKKRELRAKEYIPGNSITRMVDALQNYYLPPHIDFVTNTKINPFVVYVFEFTHKLERQELADIWQNVMPDIARIPEQQEVVFCHDLSKTEFFAGRKIPPETQWMVFKVKKRAEKSYWNVTADSQDDTRFEFDFQIGGGKKTPDYNYNWPYDYFSLVELVKLDAEVEFMPSKSKTIVAAEPARTGDGQEFEHDKSRKKSTRASQKTRNGASQTQRATTPTTPTVATPAIPLTAPTRPTGPPTRTGNY